MTPHQFVHRFRDYIRNSWPLCIIFMIIYGTGKHAAIREAEQRQADLIHDRLAPHIDAVRDEIKNTKENK